MNRRAFVLAGLAASLPAWGAGERFERGLLWRVTKRAARPSHVYGTIHVADARLAELPAPVRRAFDGARSLMLEFVPDGYKRERFLEAGMFIERQTLEGIIGPQDFERVVEVLQPIGLPRDVRVEEQIFTFDEFPMESQVALLRHSLAHRDELAEHTLQAYLARDIAGIWRLRERFIARHPQVATHHAVMTKRVVHDRNVVMAFRMQRQLRRGDAFIALGALHLYGGNGVLALLEDDGYRATRVF